MRGVRKVSVSSSSPLTAQGYIWLLTEMMGLIHLLLVLKLLKYCIVVLHIVDAGARFHPGFDFSISAPSML